MSPFIRQVTLGLWPFISLTKKAKMKMPEILPCKVSLKILWGLWIADAFFCFIITVSNNQALLPLIQEGHLSVTGESMCRKYWLTA